LLVYFFLPCLKNILAANGFSRSSFTVAKASALYGLPHHSHVEQPPQHPCRQRIHPRQPHRRRGMGDIRRVLPYVTGHASTKKRRLEDGRQRDRHPACPGTKL
jgi:hypothetical protein